MYMNLLFVTKTDTKYYTGPRKAQFNRNTSNYNYNTKAENVHDMRHAIIVIPNTCTFTEIIKSYSVSINLTNFEI